MSKLGRMAGLAWSARYPVFPFRCVRRAPRSARTRPGCGVLAASASERNSICSVIVPADGTRAATAGKRRLRYVCVFLGSSRTSRCLLVSEHMGCRAQSAMAGRKLNAKHLLGVAQFANWPGGRSSEALQVQSIRLAISTKEARVRPEGARMFQPLMSLIGAIVPI
jgi:hypothetical protein